MKNVDTLTLNLKYLIRKALDNDDYNQTKDRELINGKVDKLYIIRVRKGRRIPN